MADIFLSPCKSDRGVSQLLSAMLEASGWDLWPGSEGLFVEASLDVVEHQLSDADCVVIIWTAQTRKSQWTRLAALTALQDNRLVQVVVDGGKTPPRFEAAPVFHWPQVDIDDIADWGDRNEFILTVRSRSELASTVTDDTAIIDDKTAPDPTSIDENNPSEVALVPVSTGSEPPGTPDNASEVVLQERRFLNLTSRPRASGLTSIKRGRSRVGTFAFLATGFFMSLALVGTYWALGPEGTLSMSRNGDVTNLSRHSQSSLWRDVDKTDIEAVRAYLNDNPGSIWIRDAEHALDTLEAQFWSQIDPANGAFETLDAIEAFRLRFPMSNRLSVANVLAHEEQRRIATASELFARLNLVPELPQPALRSNLEQAVSDFESATLSDPHGVINADLIERLEQLDVNDSSIQKRIKALIDTRSRSDEVVTELRPAQNVALARSDNLSDFQSSSKPQPGKVSSETLSGTTNFDQHKVKKLKDCLKCPELVIIPTGRVIVLNTENSKASELNISKRYALSKYEVTFDDWDACYKAGGCNRRVNDMAFGRGTRPAINVNYKDAVQYTHWLSRMTHKNYRLPTETEWEYAARAGVDGYYPSDASVDRLCHFANGAALETGYAERNIFCRDGTGKITAKAGRYRANKFGLHDTIGNVWEWVADCWQPDRPSGEVNACETGLRTVRGGSFEDPPSRLTLSTRKQVPEDFASRSVGFRVLREID